MKRILVTGAGGFVGSALVKELAARAAPGDAIVAADLGFPERIEGVEYSEGPLDRSSAAGLFAEPCDVVYHLATVAGVGSRDFDLGKSTNLDLMQAMLEASRHSGKVSRFVYSSSVGVFGAPIPPRVDDDTLPVPDNSYGTHKLIGELLLNDYSRAGFIDGIALRFPGVICRPEGSATMLSAFFNNVFYAARDGRAFDFPMEPDDVCWLMSLKQILFNLVHAAQLPSGTLPARRYWTLPALPVPVGEMIRCLGEVYGAGNIAGISYRPDADMRRMFGQVPLRAATATQLGFRGDGDVAEFVRNVIELNPGLMPVR